MSPGTMANCIEIDAVLSGVRACRRGEGARMSMQFPIVPALVVSGRETLGPAVAGGSSRLLRTG